MINIDPQHLEAARQGDRAALTAIIRAVQRPIYGLALRMLAHPPDAEDATQEILIKVVTHLGSIENDQAAAGWVLKVASRHLVQRRKRSRVEEMRMTFKDFSEDLQQGLSPAAEEQPEDQITALAIEEIKIGCTLAMLTCLSRSLRMAYILGDVFELTDVEAAEALDISAAAYRQRLSRARKEVLAFLQASCGMVSSKAACRCEKRLCAAEANHRITLGAPAFGLRAPASDMVALRRQVRSLEEGRRAAALMRSNPSVPTNIGDLMLRVLGSQRLDLERPT